MEHFLPNGLVGAPLGPTVLGHRLRHLLQELQEGAKKYYHHLAQEEALAGIGSKKYKRGTLKKLVCSLPGCPLFALPGTSTRIFDSDSAPSRDERQRKLVAN